MINEVEDELFEHHRVVADKGQEPLRVDKFLLNRLEGTSRNRIQQAAVDGYIKVNDKSVENAKSHFKTINKELEEKGRGLIDKINKL